MKDIFSRINYKLNKIRFNNYLENIKCTNPITVRHDDNIEIVSQVDSVSVKMYLLAIKTFYRFIPSANITVIADRSVSDKDKSLLEAHVKGINIVPLAEVNTEGFPTGGTWERLLYIVRSSADRYVMQMDSDMFTLAAPTEVINSIRVNTAYLVGDPRWKNRILCNDMSHIANQVVSGHIQSRAESAFEKCSVLNDKYYIRGCSAFCGFPKGGQSIEFLKSFSDEMASLLGEAAWHEWGTEQLSSNIVVANSIEPKVLDWPDYRNYMFPLSNESINRFVAIHFIGSNRFRNTNYLKLAKNFINANRAK